MEASAGPAPPSPCREPLWALPGDGNVHAALQTKGVTGEDEHGRGTSATGEGGMEEPWGEEEPGGEGPRGPQEGDTAGEAGTRGPGTGFLQRHTPDTECFHLSHCDHDSCEDAHMPAQSCGPQGPECTAEPSSARLWGPLPDALLTNDCGERSPGRPPEEPSGCRGARGPAVHFPVAAEEFPLVLDPFSVLEFHEELMEEEEEAAEPGEMSADQGPGARRRGANMTEGVPVPSSEHVAEIVGRQGCKIKALRAKTNTYIKTPVRGEEPMFIVTGRKEDVEMAKCEILAAAEHFSIIRATRNKIIGIQGSTQGPPNLPGQTTIQVRVPYRVVGLVVGPKGATIKRIQQSTHTYIVTPNRDKEPVFEVTGMPENVDRAREEIEAHITMRTGSVVDFQPDNDFQSNGTDVCVDLLGGGNLWSKVPAAHRGSSGSRNETLQSSSSVESPYYGTEGRAQSHGSPFRSVLSGNIPLVGETNMGQPPVGIKDCEIGLEHLALELNTSPFWSTIETSNGQLAGCPAQRRNSGLSGCTTPLLSPTVPDNGIGLEHPLARRIQSDPVSSVSWFPNQGAFSFSNSAGYSSSSSLPNSSSVASGSPTDSSSSEGQRKSGRDCVVCFESEVIAALVPCGHNLFCMECAIRICERVLPECPACHAPATQAIRIFS